MGINVLRVGQRVAYIPGDDVRVRGGKGSGALPCYYLTFDATDDYVAIASSAYTAPFTLVHWIKLTSGANRYILGLNGTTGNRWLWYNAGLRFQVNSGGASSYTTATASGVWVHVALVIPSGSASSIYLNGVLKSGTYVTHTGLSRNTIGANNNPLTGTGAGTSNLNGSLAAFGVAPTVLDIPTLWAAGTLHKPLNPATFTLNCWNMRQEGGAGTTLIDESGAAQNGTFKGTGEPAWGSTMLAGGPAGWSDS